jgi:hypothetical protein
MGIAMAQAGFLRSAVVVALPFPAMTGDICFPSYLFSADGLSPLSIAEEVGSARVSAVLNGLGSVLSDLLDVCLGLVDLKPLMGLVQPSLG